MFGIGIIGCGKIAQVRHIPEYAAHPEAKLVGFYDINQQRAAELAAKYGGRAYATVEELLAEPEIQAVSICAANFAHAELTIAALNAGKHVLCEKPMATNLADCEAMVQAADANGKFLMIGHNQRKNTWFFDKNRAAMGAMADLGIHKTDLIQFLTGQRVIRTTARVTTLDKKDASGNLIGVDDNAICVYELSGGAMGTMTASWTYYGAEDNSTILYGTKGIMRIYDDPAAAIKVILTDGSKISYDVEAIQTNDNQTKSGVIDLWMDSLVNNREPEISGRSALTAMRAVFASLQSSELGTAVEIPENR